MSGPDAAAAAPPADVPVRDAATAVLLRDGTYGLETWLLTRVRQMAFAAGMSVFPGGRVEESDGALPWTDDAVEAFAPVLDCSVPVARAIGGAALRELFEETAVLFAQPPASRELLRERAAVEAGTTGFGELLSRHGAALDATGVRPWARWITPIGETRRYDTRFFVAVLPAGADAQDVTGEASVAGWIGVDAALGQYDRGERLMLPPTVEVLRAVARHASADEVLSAAPQGRLTAVEPIRHMDAEPPYIELPDGRVYVVGTPRPADRRD